MILPPAPRNFQRAERILCAEFTHTPHHKKRRYNGRRAQGIAYERKGHEFLLEAFPLRYVPGPWIKFFAEGRWRWCQPDGLIFNFQRGIITIVEFKYQHTTDAWWQLRHLYGPVLRHMFPEHLWSFQTCEIVKWYDPQVMYPEKIVLANEVDMDHSGFKVHIWRP